MGTPSLSDLSGGRGALLAVPFERLPDFLEVARAEVLVAVGHSTNILTDVEIIKRPVPDQNLRVHGGFLTALQEVWGTSSVLQQTAPYFQGATPVLKRPQYLRDGFAWPLLEC